MSNIIQAIAKAAAARDHKPVSVRAYRRRPPQRIKKASVFDAIPRLFGGTARTVEREAPAVARGVGHAAESAAPALAQQTYHAVAQQGANAAARAPWMHGAAPAAANAATAAASTGQQAARVSAWNPAAIAQRFPVASGAGGVAGNTLAGANDPSSHWYDPKRIAATLAGGAAGGYGRAGLWNLGQMSNPISKYLVRPFTGEHAVTSIGSGAAGYFDPDLNRAGLAWNDPRRLAMGVGFGLVGGSGKPSAQRFSTGHMLGGGIDAAVEHLYRDSPTHPDPHMRWLGGIGGALHGTNLVNKAGPIGEAVNAVTKPFAKNPEGWFTPAKELAGTGAGKAQALMLRGGNAAMFAPLTGMALPALSRMSGADAYLNEKAKQLTQQGVNVIGPAAREQSFQGVVEGFESTLGREATQSLQAANLAEQSLKSNDIATAKRLFPELPDDPAAAQQHLTGMKRQAVAKAFGMDNPQGNGGIVGAIKALPADQKRAVVQEFISADPRLSSMLNGAAGMGGFATGLGHLADGLLGAFGLPVGNMSMVQKVMILLGGLGLIGGLLGGSGTAATLGGAAVAAGVAPHLGLGMQRNYWNNQPAVAAGRPNWLPGGAATP